MELVDLKTRDDVDRSFDRIEKEIRERLVLLVQLGYEKRKHKVRRSYDHKPLTAFGMRFTDKSSEELNEKN